MLRQIYRHLPNSFQPRLKILYDQLHPQRVDENKIETEFVGRFFDSQKEYLRYRREWEESQTSEIRSDALNTYSEMTGRDHLSAIDATAAKRYYALVRKLSPEIVVETGVCNGVSTLSLLLALDRNEHGKLYSIDYPFYAGESLEEFREETFEGYGGAAIPADKEPGWIIPSGLRSRWQLRIGKSQRVLPELVNELDHIDVFAHDSEHSVPCMLFEFEMAWEWLSEEGVILSDDVGWNDAFETFLQARNATGGLLSEKTGYITQPK